MTIEWLAGNRIIGTSTERTGATVAHATPTKIIDGNYTVLTYTADGKFIPKGSFNVDYLVVGGGASGGGKGASGSGKGGAGGGAGQLLTGTSSVTAQSYSITVGSGGDAQTSQDTNGNDGNSSVFNSITSLGGGGGASGSSTAGSNGGSGGGGSSSGATNGAGGSGQATGGNNGGAGGSDNATWRGSGGGGGSGSAGSVPVSGTGGAGGSGTSSSITGTATFYSAGGGGHIGGGTGGTGGSSIGGNGGAGGASGTDATGYGSGGGGAGGSASAIVSGAGSNGVVIIRFLTSGNDYDVEEIGLMPSLQSGSVGGWHEVGRTTLESAGDTIDVSGLADKRYYMVLHNSISTGNVTSSVRLNGDSGNNYAWRYNDNGASPDPTPIINNNAMNAGDRNPPTGGDAWAVSYLANKSGNEKLMISSGLQRNTAGASHAPTRGETASKWIGTAVIDQITSVNQESGDWASGSEMVVLGWDPADSHTTNFWEELASVELSSSNTNLSSGTFTAKKYLWVQIYYIPTGAVAANMTFNNDTTTYAWRYSAEGSQDYPQTSEPNINIQGSNSSTPVFHNMFIINNSANEKLVIHYNVDQMTAGAGTAPKRREIVGKWDNTSSQITEIDLNTTSNAYDTGSIIKVWGAD